MATPKRGTVHQREFLQHDSHKATCSFRYERQGQTRITPGLAARQLNSMELRCREHVLFEVFSDGAKILSRDTMGDLWHWIPALKSTVETIIQLKVILVSKTTQHPALFDQKRQKIQEQHAGGMKWE